MTTYLRRRPRPIGAAPGVLSSSVEDASPLGIRILRYRAAGDVEAIDVPAGGSLPPVEPGATLWVNLVGHEDIPALAAVAQHFDIPGLVVEDAIDVSQRPMFSGGSDWMFVSMRRIWIDREDELQREQLGLYLSAGLIVTFQEYDGDAWDAIRLRLEDPQATLRTRGADYLWYRLIDATVDAYYLIMDRIAERLETVEDEIFDTLPGDIPRRLGEIRKESVALRRASWPLREALDQMGRHDGSLLEEETARLFADVRDHASQVSEVNDMLRESVGANMDTYISLVGMQQNEVMRVLTLVATIFIPLTFIAGVYGMNFESMPELSQPLGYPIVWAVMIATTVGLLLYFRRKGWL